MGAVMTCIEDCLTLAKDGIAAVQAKDISKLPVLIEEATAVYNDCKKAADGPATIAQIRRFLVAQGCKDDIADAVALLKDLMEKGMAWNCGMDCLQQHFTQLQTIANK